MVDLKHYRKWAKLHPNFMSPHIERLWDLGKHVIELSSGTDFHHKPIWGVTLLRMCGDNYSTCRLAGIDKVFWSRTEALEHIKTKVKNFLENATEEEIKSAF